MAYIKNKNIFKKMCFKLAMFLTDKSGMNHKDRYIIYWYLQIILFQIVEAYIIVSLSFALGIFWQTIYCATLYFFSKFLIGEYHTDFISCSIISTVTFLIGGFIFVKFGLVSATLYTIFMNILIATEQFDYSLRIIKQKTRKVWELLWTMAEF